MPAKKPPAKPKRPYHHGDLRRALLDAARALVARHGMAALTLREVARKVGVTHAAPYHHFPTREALLDALAEEGFALLDQAMQEALATSPGLEGRLVAIGRAYADFARAHPERLEVMFRRKTPGGAAEEFRTTPAGLRVHPRVFAHLFDAVVARQQAGLAPAGDPYALALAAWSLVHGFSKLWVEGPLDALPPYADRYEALRDDLLQRFDAAWCALARSSQSARKRR